MSRYEIFRVMNANIHTHIQTNTHRERHTQTGIHTDTHTHTSVHTHAHIQTHKHTYDRPTHDSSTLTSEMCHKVGTACPVLT